LSDEVSVPVRGCM